MIRIHLETEQRREEEEKEGRGEQGRELALAYMWQIHMETGPRRVEEEIASTEEICCGRGTNPACRWGPA